jgi:hypothetical protein
MISGLVNLVPQLSGSRSDPQQWFQNTRAWTFVLRADLPLDHALKARSIPAQGNTLGKLALFPSCAL